MSKADGNVLLSSGILASMIATQMDDKKAKYVTFSDLATFSTIFDNKLIELGAYNHLPKQPFMFTSPMFEQAIKVRNPEIFDRCRTIFNRYVKRCGDIFYNVKTQFSIINSRTYSKKVFFESSSDEVLKKGVHDSRARQRVDWKNMDEKLRKETLSTVYVYRKSKFSNTEKAEALDDISEFVKDFYEINGYPGIDTNKIKEAVKFAVNVFARNDFDKFNSEYNTEILRSRDLYEENEQDSLFEAFEA